MKPKRIQDIDTGLWLATLENADDEFQWVADESQAWVAKSHTAHMFALWIMSGSGYHVEGVEVT